MKIGKQTADYTTLGYNSKILIIGDIAAKYKTAREWRAKDYLAGRKYVCSLASYWLITYHPVFMDQSGFILARSYVSAYF